MNLGDKTCYEYILKINCVESSDGVIVLGITSDKILTFKKK